MHKKLLQLTEHIPDNVQADTLVFDEQRAYIGGSSIGHPCDRHVAMRLRGFPQVLPSTRLQIIFDTGHFLEARMVQHIHELLEMIDKDARLTHTGEDQARFHAYGHVCQASPDGIVAFADGSRAIVEIKSASATRFRMMPIVGVRHAAPEYWDQMQFNMGIGEIGGAVFVAIEKDTSRLHSEPVTFDPSTFDYLMARVEYICAGGDERIANDPTDWRCRTCGFHRACWQPEEVPLLYRTCRHCRHSTFDDKSWVVCNHPIAGKQRPLKRANKTRAVNCDFYEDRRLI